MVETVTVASHERKKRGREPKANTLPVREVIHELTGADRVCPLYRMEKMLLRSGLVVSLAGLCQLAVSVGRALGDLIEMINRDIVRSPVMLMDETTVQVLSDGRAPPGKGSYMWAAVGFVDGKPIHRFAYHPNRSGSFADTLLEGFSGYI